MTGAKDFMILAERDYTLCRKLESEFPDDYAVSAAAYHIQQAVEKTLKGLILLYGGEIEFTHNIGKLISQCEQAGAVIGENTKDIADTLTLWESSVRYDPYISFSQKKYDAAKAAYEEVSQVLQNELLNCSAEEKLEDSGMTMR